MSTITRCLFLIVLCSGSDDGGLLLPPVLPSVFELQVSRENTSIRFAAQELVHLFEFYSAIKMFGLHHLARSSEEEEFINHQ